MDAVVPRRARRGRGLDVVGAYFQSPGEGRGAFGRGRQRVVEGVAEVKFGRRRFAGGVSLPGVTGIDLTQRGASCAQPEVWASGTQRGTPEHPRRRLALGGGVACLWLRGQCWGCDGSGRESRSEARGVPSGGIRGEVLWGLWVAPRRRCFSLERTKLWPTALSRSWRLGRARIQGMTSLRVSAWPSLRWRWGRAMKSAYDWEGG